MTILKMFHFLLEAACNLGHLPEIYFHPFWVNTFPENNEFLLGFCIDISNLVIYLRIRLQEEYPFRLKIIALSNLMRLIGNGLFPCCLQIMSFYHTPGRLYLIDDLQPPRAPRYEGRQGRHSIIGELGGRPQRNSQRGVKRSKKIS